MILFVIITTLTESIRPFLTNLCVIRSFPHKHMTVYFWKNLVRGYVDSRLISAVKMKMESFVRLAEMEESFVHF